MCLSRNGLYRPQLIWVFLGFMVFDAQTFLTMEKNNNMFLAVSMLKLLINKYTLELVNLYGCYFRLSTGLPVGW